MLSPFHQIAFKVLCLFSYIAQKSIRECEADAGVGADGGFWLVKVVVKVGCCGSLSTVVSDVVTSEHGQHPVHKVLKNALKLSHLSARSVPFQFCEHLSKEKGEN